MLQMWGNVIIIHSHNNSITYLVLGIFHVQGNVALQGTLHTLCLMFVANLLGTCCYEPLSGEEKWVGRVSRSHPRLQN